MPRPDHAAAIAVIAAALASGFGLLPAPPAQAQAQAASVELTVAKLRNNQGTLGCQLFASAEGFPTQRERARASVLAPIVDGHARCSFSGLRAGSYAVAVMHDENGNRKLDTNLLGMPTEGYGVSNNRTHAMSAPRWEDARFELADGEAKLLSITLRY
jgi:uncharacterized protein (DUF2141 family)